MLGHEAESPPILVWIAGTGWDAVPGTDKRLVEELSGNHRIVWIDPPVRYQITHLLNRRFAPATLAAPNIVRVPVHTLPGGTRLVIRKLTSMLLNRAITRALAPGGKPTAVVVACPTARFPDVPGLRILHVTDDWLEGASLMGLSKNNISHVLKSNINSADVVTAVTPGLLEELAELGTIRNGSVLPNGCPIAGSVTHGIVPGREIGLVGQLNERLDMDVLEALCRSGEKILVVGPRSDREASFGKRLDSFLAAENVEWAGSVAHSVLPEYFARMRVGVTPYTDSLFNHASFPLKTLEYLSAGLPVVATDLPAARWLNSVHVQVAADTADFAAKVVASLRSERTQPSDDERRQFARQHSWEQRASDFSLIIQRGVRGTEPMKTFQSQDMLQGTGGTVDPK